MANKRTSRRLDLGGVNKAEQSATRPRGAGAARSVDLSARASMLSSYGGGIHGSRNGPRQGDNTVVDGQQTQLSTLGGVWFSPGQPLRPVAQDAERQFDYPFAYNLRLTPRGDAETEGISFTTLRGLADSCDILRLVIETRKDQIASYDWEILPADLEKDVNGYAEPLTPEQQAMIKQLTKFFNMPCIDPQFGIWDNWLRGILEDLLVLDTMVLSPRTNMLGSKVMSLDLVDGGTIKRLIDGSGRTPLPPQPAYQQVLHGLPAVTLSDGQMTAAEKGGGQNFKANELIYWMRNPRTNRIYGYSPVEQVIMTVNTALRKALSDLNYYTEGNIPDAFCGVPETWTLEMIKQFQGWWDVQMEGDLAQRRKMKFVPMDASKMKETRPPQLKDEYWDWLTRIICFAFSIPPTSFISAVNRATAQTAQTVAEDEGLAPLLKWLSGRFNWIIENVLGIEGYEFKWKMKAEVDPATQSEIHQRYLQTGVLTSEEVRADLGRTPFTPEQKQEAKEAVQGAKQVGQGGEGSTGDGNAPSGASGKPGDKKKGSGKQQLKQEEKNPS